MNKLIRCVSCVVLLAGTFKVNAQSYSIAQVQELGGSSSNGDFLYATATNASGQVIGYQNINGNTYGFFYEGGTSHVISGGVGTAINAGGQVVGNGSNGPFIYSNNNSSNLNLGAINGTYASAINDSNQIAGVGTIGQSIHVYKYINGAVQDLGEYGNTSNSIVSAKAINSSGQVLFNVGSNFGGTNKAFIYSNGVSKEIGSLGGNITQSNAMNNAGQIVGYSYTSILSGTPSHAFMYSNGVLQDLGTLGGTVSNATAINDAGLVTGESLTSNGANHAFLYSSGSMQDLGTLGGSYSTAYGINNSGQIVGSSLTSMDSSNHAFIFRDGNMFDLNSLINPSSPLALYVTLNEAAAITDTGYILAKGRDTRDTSYVHYYLLSATPVPIPLSSWLLVGGLGWLSMFVRKRRVAA